MSQYIEATFLQVINESHETCTAPRICHHQQHLGPPELHMVFTHIQPQKVLTYLSERWNEKDGMIY